MRFILLITVVIAISLSILTGCKNAAATKPVETVKTNTTNTNSVQKVDEQKPMDEAPRITLADAKKDFDEGKATFVDTRAEVQYNQEHIKGAINIPMEAVEMRYKEIPTDKKIIAYCS